MGRKGFKKKSKWDGLPTNFAEAVQGSTTDEIRKRISDIAILNCEMKKTLENDAEVASAKESLKHLMEPYREDFKSFKLQIDYLKSVLDDKDGGATTAAAGERASASAIEEFLDVVKKGNGKVTLTIPGQAPVVVRNNE